MMERKKKLRFIQFFLLTFGITIIYLTYYNKDEKIENSIISKQVQKETEKEKLNEGDLFFDVQYTGLDLNSNRYILNAEEAKLDELKPEIVYMKDVSATFYFKDSTVLFVYSDVGEFNNKNFDMKFEQNVRAEYLNSKLFAEKAEYSNTENYLSIYENVRINDIRGNLIADKLLFDITSQKLDITSFDNGKINANVKLDER